MMRIDAEEPKKVTEEVTKMKPGTPACADVQLSPDTDTEADVVPKDITVNIPTIHDQTSVTRPHPQDDVNEEEELSSAATDVAVENMVTRGYLLTSHDDDNTAHVHDPKPVCEDSAKRINIAVDDSSNETLTNDDDSAKVETVNDHCVNEGATSSHAREGKKLAGSRMISEGLHALESVGHGPSSTLETETDLESRSSETTLRSADFPDKEAEVDLPPVQNVVKRDVVVEAVDIGVLPQQAQVIGFPTVTETDEDSQSMLLNANEPNGTAKVCARSDSAGDGPASADSINDGQIAIEPPVSRPLPMSTIAALTSTPSDKQSVMAKTTVKRQTKQDRMPLALKLRVVVTLPLVVVVLYCTYRFSHLPMTSRSAPITT